jgi:inhibitor of cysteine peptidase
MQVDESDNGRRVLLHVGETLEIRLSENASTGYQWAVSSEPAVTEKIFRPRAQVAEGPSGPPGKSGFRHLYFDAVGTGSADLELEYRRPWESKTSRPARRFKIFVRVEPAQNP